MEYEIDFRKYLRLVGRRLRWVVCAALLAGVAMFSLLTAAPKTYTATSALLLLVRQAGTVRTLDSPGIRLESIDAEARRQGLVALATSTTIETRIPEDVIRSVMPENYRPGLIVQNQQIEVHLNGDLLEIVAHARTPEQAKALADGWANSYMDYVSHLYRDEHSEIRFVSAALLPHGPSSPLIWANTIQAVIGGALLAMIAVLIAGLIESTSGVVAPAAN